MTRSSWFATAVAVAAALAVPVTAGAQAPAGDSVSGSGTADVFGPFQIDIRSGPNGENPTGQVSIQPSFGLVTGAPSCLAVRGNVATFSVPLGRITLAFEVTDNAGLGIPDVIRGISLLASSRDCSPLSAATTGVVRSGDIVAVDAPPLPTSKAQCKDGGWHDYGVFKNQGDCVSFVASGGKGPQPGT